jgi:hypothetical protein
VNIPTIPPQHITFTDDDGNTFKVANGYAASEFNGILVTLENGETHLVSATHIITIAQALSSVKAIDQATGHTVPENRTRVTDAVLALKREFA